MKLKASFRSKYGSPEILSIRELGMPIPKDDEVLIRVIAATVNRTDYGLLKGTPFILRFFSGLFKPKFSITGTDFAGQIEGIGINVTSFKVGDRVMGFGGMGVASHAEYLTIPEAKAILAIPANTSYEQAAAGMEGAFYALNGIDAVNPEAGQKALVYGATGAIGSSSVQLLRFFGLHVTAVCGSENIGLVKSLGADRIIDYKKDDFTKDNEQYDFVFDAVGKTSFSSCKRLLKKHGVFIPSDGFVNVFLSLATRITGGKRVVFSPPTNLKSRLSFIRDLLETGSFKPVIDRNYPIDEIVEAYKYVATGQKIGNVIIIMGA